MKNRRPFFLNFFLFLLVFGCSQDKNTADQARSRATMSVEGYVASESPIENTLIIPGNILPNEQIEIRSELSGRIEVLNFSEGSFVKKGTLLVKVDDTELRAQLQKLEAQMTQAKADEVRKKQLIDVSGITREEYDASVTRVKELDADIKLIRTRIGKSSITAPFDGFVGLRLASPGAYVSPGDIISTLVETDPAKIEFNVPEKYVGGIAKDLDITFKLSGGTEVFSGKVYATDPMIDANSRALKIRALCSNKANKLFPGAYVEVTLQLEKIDNAIMIPTMALVPLMNGENVYLINNGKVKLTQVSTGLRNERMIQVVSGIDKGDTLAVTGLLALRDGIPVAIGKIVTQ
ncbi:MAG TPA: efflux RND transporter periplasmic adaptor subunit [Cyclobacteriaceae bacterium]|nr:efflux RND transporter periplasmic adaptor subunit [Cyclobacteriaceae bacterium]